MNNNNERSINFRNKLDEIKNDLNADILSLSQEQISIIHGKERIDSYIASAKELFDKLSDKKITSEEENLSGRVLYLINSDMSQVLWPYIQFIELSFRNRTADILVKYVPDWYKKGKLATVLNNTPILQYSKLFSKTKDKIQNNKKRILKEISNIYEHNKNGKNITITDVISNVPFGFWYDLIIIIEYYFDEKNFLFCSNETLFQTNQDFKQDLNCIKILRNNIAHHENIIKSKQIFISKNFTRNFDITDWITLCIKLEKEIITWVKNI